MSNKINMNELSEVTGATPRDIHNWMERLSLSTKYGPALMGRAAERTGRFTKENAMEILLIARLVANGMTPAAATERISRLFAQLKNRKPNGYALFYGDTVSYGDDPPSERLVNFFQKTGVIVNVVPIGRFAEEIDEFFARAGDQDDER